MEGCEESLDVDVAGCSEQEQDCRVRREFNDHTVVTDEAMSAASPPEIWAGRVSITILRIVIDGAGAGTDVLGRVAESPALADAVPDSLGGPKRLVEHWPVDGEPSTGLIKRGHQQSAAARRLE